MLADGTFNEIAQKWKLEESVCLGQSGADEVLLAETDRHRRKILLHSWEKSLCS